MNTTTYSDSEKAEALAVLDASGGNLKRAARDAGVPRTTLREWRDGQSARISDSDRHQKKTALSEKLEAIAWKLTNGITEEKIAKASLGQLMTALGITIDKLRLLRGEATSIREDRQVQEIRTRLESKLLQVSIEAQKAGSIPATTKGKEA